MDRSINIFSMIAGMAFVPMLLSFAYIFEGANVGDILMSSSIYIIYYPPLLAAVSVFAVHFKGRHAIYPILLMPVMEFIGDPLIVMATSGLLPNVTPDLLGKSMLVVVCPLIAGLSMLHQISMFRFLTFVLGSAQCLTLILFHHVAISDPMSGMVSQETYLTQSIAIKDGDVHALCGLRGYQCYRGDVIEASRWAEARLRNPQQTLNIISDTTMQEQLLFTWIENATPTDLHQISLITYQKLSQNDVMILVNNEGPTLLYGKLVVSLGILIAVFHQVWIFLTLAILGRHGDYVYKGFRWRRYARSR